MLILKRFIIIIVIIFSIYSVLILSNKVFSADFNISNKITVCFRCDDFFAAENHPKGKAIYDVKRRIVELFKKHNIPLTIGVIPEVHNSLSGHLGEYTRLTKNDPVGKLLKDIKNDNNFEIAQHGLTHLPNHISKDSEFIGLSLVAQNTKISQGKQILLEALGQFDLATFIPPWNSFDLNTINALRTNGFEYLSGDTGIIRNDAFTFRSQLEKEFFELKIIPGTCSLKELMDVVQLSRNDLSDTIIIVIFHPYDFQEYRDERTRRAFFNLTDLAKILKEVNNNSQLNFSRIKDINSNRLSSSRYTTACRYYLLIKIWKSIFSKKFMDYMGFTDEKVGWWLDKGRYLSEISYARLYYRILYFFAICSIILSIIFGFLINCLIKIKAKKLNKVIIHLIFWAIFCVGILFLESKLEIVTSPNMTGVLITYCIGFLSMYLCFFLGHLIIRFTTLNSFRYFIHLIKKELKNDKDRLF